MEFRILGPVELWAGGKNHPLGPRKERGVLALLLWELGRPIPTETLVSRIWGAEASDRASELLHQNVSRLRRRLREAGGTDRELPKRSRSYVLHVSRQDVDVCQFRALNEKASAAFDHGDDEHAVTLFREADALWRGTPLDGLDGDWVEGIRARLNEDRYDATVMRMEAGLRLGRHAGLVGELFALAAQYPLREEPTKFLMHALYRSGRSADALQVFRRFHRNYVDEMGVEPTAGLRHLHEMMLKDDPDLAVMLTARPMPAASPPVPASSLPRDNPDFTGRTTELETLAGWMNSGHAESTVPVIVISGRPGIGKTTLAVHAAHVLGERYAEQLFVELRGHSPDNNPVEPAAALGTLLHSLGVSDHVIPDSVEDRAALWRSRLAGKRALIVLDDAADSARILPLLPSAPGCVVLITSRRTMTDVPGMRWLSLDPMPPTEAAALFERSAGEGRKNEEAGVATILRLCGYVPQEIQLAARELRRHPAWDVRDLEARLREIRAEDHAANPAIELSYRHLTAAQQRLLRQLALHPGPGFSRHAAMAVAGDQSLGDTQRALDVLQDYYLIKEPVPGRFAFHDRIRGYAKHLARAHDSDADRDRTMRRLLDYYLCLADQADRALYPFHRRIPAIASDIPSVLVPPASPPLRTRLDYRRWMEAERPGLLAVTRYAAATGQFLHAGLLPHVLANFLDASGFWADATELHRLAVTAWRTAGNASGEAKALTELSFMLARMGDYGEALRHASDALALARTAKDRVAEADALDRMGIILWKEARYPEALARYDEALAICQALGDEDGEADTLMHSGIAAWHLNRYPDAMRRTERALVLYRELRDSQGEANALNNLGDLQQDAGEKDEALGSYRSALDMFRDLGDRQGEAIAVNNIGDAYRNTGRLDDALACYRAALDIYRDIGDLRCEADTLNNLGAAYLQLGRHNDALDHHHNALILAHQIAERFLMVKSLNGSGSVQLASGNYSPAADDYQTAIELSRQIGDRNQEAHALVGLGDALHADGEKAARMCWVHAVTIFEHIGKPTAADDVRARLERSVA